MIGIVHSTTFINFIKIAYIISIILLYVFIVRKSEKRSKKFQFNTKSLYVLGFIILVVVVAKNIIPDEPYAMYKEIMILFGNSLMFGYSMIFLVGSLLENRKGKKTLWSESRIYNLIIGSILFIIFGPVLSITDFSDKYATTIFLNFKYTDYLGFLADLITVAGIMVAFIQLAKRINIENSIIETIDNADLSSIKQYLQDDMKKIIKRHKLYKKNNPVVYELLIKHYKDDLLRLDYSFHYMEFGNLVQSYSEDERVEITDILIKEYIQKIYNNEKKKKIKDWIHREIKNHMK